MNNTEKIRTVSEFTGLELVEAEQFLIRTAWNVDDAINQALISSQPDQGSTTESIRTPLLNDQRPGQGQYAPWQLVKKFFQYVYSCIEGIVKMLFPGKPDFYTQVKTLYPSLSEEEITRRLTVGPLRRTLGQQPPQVALIALYGEMTRDVLIETVISRFIQTGAVHAVDVETNEGFEFARNLRVRNLPTFLAVMTGTLTEIGRAELVGVEGFLDRIRSYQEGAELEKDKISRDRAIREEQDREYAALIAKDQAKKTAINSLVQAREDAKKRFLTITEDQLLPETTRISIKLKNGSRMERKFPVCCPASILYDWLIAAPLLEEYHSLSEILTLLKPGNFYLSTTFPSRRLAADAKETLTDLRLVPNALLALTLDEPEE